MLRILEGIGQQVRALGAPDEQQWTTVSALLSYILGVGGQNAANAQIARTRGADRSDFLETVGPPGLCSIRISTRSHAA